jgi:hypothetical protein
MIRVTSFVLIAALAAITVAAPVPPPGPREAAQLVEKLGSQSFAEREAATKRLDELGVLALGELRAACKSEDPEVASRAKDLVAKIERRISNERAIAPTMVELDAKDIPLDAVLAALSKQAGCEVVLGGLKPDELAGKKVTVATGKVPFWTAVLWVCDAAELQVANVSGFVAPGSMPYLARPGKPGAGEARRVAAVPSLAVVLEARDSKKRPASVHGAVLVEAFELPKIAASNDVAAAVLQIWPEPKLAWQSASNLKITKSVGTDGAKLVPDLTPPRAMPQVERLGGRMAVIRNPDGSITVVNPDAKNPISAGPNFTANVRQTLVKLKTGEKVASVLTGSVYGQVRSVPEPLVTIALDGQKPISATGRTDSELTASLFTNDKGREFVIVKLTYNPLTVQPVRASEELVKPGDDNATVKPGPDGNNQTIHGLRITDADGKAFDATLASATNDFDHTGSRRIVMNLRLELPATKDAPAAPTKVVFWGTYLKSVEVPFALKDVPLVGGK